MHNDYGFTRAWVDFLVEKLKDKKEFESLFKVASQTAVDSTP
jgi:hypothetical protein